MTMPSRALHFLDVGDGLFVEDAAFRLRRIARGQHHHGQLFVDQRVGAVLHLAGGVAFGVNVGNLLQLERALERDREMNAAAQEQKIGGAEKLAAQLFVNGIVREHGFELAGNAQQLLHQAARRGLVQHAHASGPGTSRG